MNFNDCQIAVIGDIALDFYYFAVQSPEISVETGLPINYVTKNTYGAGGAGNLAVNIATLGAGCDLYGICGEDIWADILKKSLEQSGVNTENYLGVPGFSTFVYHKIYNEKDEELPRYDIGANNVYTPEAVDLLLSRLQENLGKYDLLVVNQQFSNTLHTPYFQEKFARLLKDCRIPVWLDARENIDYPNCCYKMNISEAQAHSGKTLPEDCVRELFAHYRSESFEPMIVVTLGADGAIAYDGKEISSVQGIRATWTMDTVGAGDAFLSGLACSLGAGKDLREALRYANASAAVSTKTLRATGHPKCSEIEEILGEVLS